tara:strand:- start:4915 stop:5574 length:660 start_codon:yes stop_codon:yes gene_type:complete
MLKRVHSTRFFCAFYKKPLPLIAMKLHKLISGLFIFLFSISINAQSQSTEASGTINWMSWQQMVEAQKVERKKVFMDLYTDWCGWCKKMDASTFVDPTIVNYMNTNYYAVKLDAEQKEDIEFNGYKFINPNPTGKRSTHQLAVSLLDGQLSYPSFVILDENISRQHIIKGFQQPEPLFGTLMFFKTNEFVRYQQYLDKQAQVKAAQQAQQAQTQETKAP